MSTFVMPAEAGIHTVSVLFSQSVWTPAFAGVTVRVSAVTVRA
jgi:hypothetical protein